MRPRRLTRRIDVGDLAFQVTSDARDAPTADRQAIVLVHGIGMSRRYLARLHDALRADAWVCSIELPGFGGLPKPGREVDVAEMGRALGDVVASIGAAHVVLVGHSMGAQWVVEAAVQRPDAVSRVVAIGPVADVAHRSAGAQLRALALDTLLETPTTNWMVTSDYLRCGVPWYLAQLRPMLSCPLEDRVALLSMPLLVIRGGLDPIAGTAWCRLLRDRAGDGTLVHIPGRPHNAHRSAPRAVAAAILAHA